MQRIDTNRGWRCKNMDETMNFKNIKKEVERIKSGINGLDNFMEGGFPKGSNIVISGLPGTGKSLFGMSFIAEGCRNGERCLYITVEQTPEAIIKQANQFNYNFTEWQEQGNLKIVHFNFLEPISKKMLENVLQSVENESYDRVVIDSISAIAHAPVPISYMGFLELFDKTTKNGITTVCIAQKDEREPTNKMLEYIGDGLILFEKNILGQTPNRTITIDKLRWTKINELPHDFEFAENGIVIQQDQSL
jgi:KaiC/GvpD/RAD55 family RecA-like ATPase